MNHISNISFVRAPTILILALSLAFAANAADHGKKRGNIGANGPKPGSTAPDFSLQTVDGKTVKASTLWSQKPTVIMTGSHTCPVFRGKVSPFEALAKEFGDRVHFLVVYTVEAHPKGDPSPYSGKEWVTPQNEKEGILLPQPKTDEARLAVAKVCIAKEKLSVRVVLDTIENKVWKAYGSAPNCAYLIDRNGKVVESEPWMEPINLRRAITQALGSGS